MTDKYSKYSMDIPYSLLSTGASTVKHSNNLLKIQLRTIYNSMSLTSSNTLVKQFWSVNAAQPKRYHLLSHFLGSNQDERSKEMRDYMSLF